MSDWLVSWPTRHRTHRRLARCGWDEYFIYSELRLSLINSANNLTDSKVILCIAYVLVLLYYCNAIFVCFCHQSCNTSKTLEMELMSFNAENLYIKKFNLQKIPWLSVSVIEALIQRGRLTELSHHMQHGIVGNLFLKTTKLKKEKKKIQLHQQLLGKKNIQESICVTGREEARMRGWGQEFSRQNSWSGA